MPSMRSLGSGRGRWLRAGLTLALLTAACAPTPARPAARTRPAAYVPGPVFSSGTPLERFLPLVDGHRYVYEFETSDGKHGLLPVLHRRSDERHGAWEIAGGGNEFEYAADGVLTFGAAGATHLLKLPTVPGARWPGNHLSMIEVRRTDVTLTVPAGTFSGCVETHETRGGDAPLDVVAAFCPEVGMVERTVATGGKRERLVLKSYGPPVDVGPDGVRVIKGE
ncbi:MAG: hypothetical protein FJ096_01175 [Deltaproteobacteria bacterium]|nr:hypothetical protein [Deltaproteobacteria bacterium]